jgi:hypothetical protein
MAFKNSLLECMTATRLLPAWGLSQARVRPLRESPACNTVLPMLHCYEIVFTVQCTLPIVLHTSESKSALQCKDLQVLEEGETFPNWVGYDSLRLSQ